MQWADKMMTVEEKITTSTEVNARIPQQRVAQGMDIQDLVEIVILRYNHRPQFFSNIFVNDKLFFFKN